LTKKNPKPAVSNAKSMGLKSKITFHAILWCFKFTFIGVVLASFVFLSLHQNLPSTEDITSTKLKTPLRVFSSEGLLIAEFGDERITTALAADKEPALLPSKLRATTFSVLSKRI